MLTPGRIADEPVVVRTPFEVEDVAQTERERDLRRSTAVRVYNAQLSVIEDLINEIRQLPVALAAAESLDGVADEIERRFGLTPERFAAVRAEAQGDQPSESWVRRTNTLGGVLRRVPMVSSEEFQRLALTTNKRLRLNVGLAQPNLATGDNAINVEAPEESLQSRFEDLARRAGFDGAQAEVVASRLNANESPTFSFDAEATAAAREEAAASVETVTTAYEPGRVLANRGERIDEATAAILRAEREAWRDALPSWSLAMYAAGALLVGLATVGGLGGYLALFYPRILTKPWRCAALAVLVVGALAAAGLGATVRPNLGWLAMATPVALVTMILVIAYDRRLALAAGALTAALVVIALERSPGVYAALLAGIVMCVWKLNDIRNRSDVVTGSLWVGAALAVSTAAAGMLGRPLVEGLLSEALTDAALAGLGGLAAGAVTLFILPTVERVFDITTGMTLSELRDPRQPLLRELQQRAPGTYNHSLNVATIAEAAADAIGADGLHLYVGALYHDVGKMNKPDYFVENQEGGFNRHSKLSPQMSLLVIMGHVKDGVELARQYALPRSLHHYIESHHGTTLVRYFYEQARKQADEDEAKDAPSETEYRYSGPKPRTKEAAILLLCDAVESATRAMSEPTPARIGALVREMAAQRLADGQFDESDLTLRELHIIEERLIKALCSVYHGRIAYPSSDRPERSAEKAQPAAAAATQTQDGLRTAAVGGTGEVAGVSGAERIDSGPGAAAGTPEPNDVAEAQRLDTERSSARAG
jgi:hypothetical protein